MFTGIIEATGKIKAIHPKQGDSAIEFNCIDLDMSDVRLGDSIAVNGVCLTVIKFSDSEFTADVSSETISKSGFRDAVINSKVNFEKAMLANSRLGGHMVSGHVDGIGEVINRQQDARSWRFQIKVPSEIARYIATKGSITVDGISLTVNSVEDTGESSFDVNIVPHTIASTIMGDYQVGTRVNIEVDLIARYLERLIHFNEDTTLTSSLTEEKLRDFGFGKSKA